MTAKQLSDNDFQELRSYIHKLCGLYLQNEKKYLILQRLEPLLEDLGCESFADFNASLRENPTQGLHDRIIASITTNETSFFRDCHPFESFAREVLPQLADRVRNARHKGEDPKPLRFWCTAVSTGQEAYSLAILIKEYIDAHPGFSGSLDDFQILATDISSRVLERAGKGCFNEVEIARGLSEERREKHFYQDGKGWTISEELRSIVDFRRINLTDPYGVYSDFDAIFCRNVLIYFDDDTKRTIIDMLYRKLSDNGVLFLGSAENLYNLTMKFRSEQLGPTIIYKKNL